MTVIVGLVIPDKGVFLGGDSFGSDGFTGAAYVRPKVFKKDEFLIGVCGSYRLMQLLEFKLVIPDKTEKQSIDSYLYGDFVEAVRTCVKNGGALQADSGVETLGRASFIFAFRGKLYEFQNDFSILEPKCGYTSTGSGIDHAQSSLYSTENTELLPEERIKRAIQCANNFVISVNDECTVLFQEYNNA